MKFAKLALFSAALALTPAVATAQSAGTTIYGSDGQPIGTVESNDGSVVTVDTGTYKAPLPAGAFAELEIGWSINATQAQINGLMAQQEAAANQRRDAALVVGAPVMRARNLRIDAALTLSSAPWSMTFTQVAGVIRVSETCKPPVPQPRAMGTSRLA